MRGGLTGLLGRDFEAILHEIASLEQPAYIKDGDLRYVAVNDAYCALARAGAERLIGNETRRAAVPLAGYDRDEKERRALVFGRAQTTVVRHSSDKRQFRARMHQLCDRDGFRYVVGLFEPKQPIRFEGWQDRTAPTPAKEVALKQGSEKPGGASVIRLPETAALPKSSNRMARALDALDCAIAAWDRDHCLVACNRAFRDRYPHVRDWSKGRSLKEMVIEVADSGLIQEAVKDRRAWIESHLTRRMREIGEDEAIRTANGRSTLWRGYSTGDGDRIMIGTDISQVVGKQRQAANDATFKPAFFANLAHDIRTPMNGILGMAELLRTSGLDQKQQMFADVITKSAQALFDIFNDVIDYSHSEVGILTLREQAFSLTEVIEDVASVFSARFAEKDLSFHTDIDPELSRPLSGDAFRIRQVINNLIGNAIAHSDIGQIRLTARCTADGGDVAAIRVAVKDCGPGLSEEKRQSVFDMFSRAAETTWQNGECAGLGLTLCARLIKLMGGEIGVDSSPGAGSEFWFELTLPVAASGDGHWDKLEEFSGSRILFVCADGVLCDQASKPLSALPLDYCVAEDVEEGLKVLGAADELQLPIDLVLACGGQDINDAAEIAGALHSAATHAVPPVILAGSGQLALDQDQRERLGIAAHIASVADASALRQAVASALGSGACAKSNSARTPDRVGAIPVGVDAADTVHGARTGDVLVAEDNEVNQIVFAETLQQLGYAYRIVPDGEQALAAWRKSPPDVVLMDLAMPVKNGLQAAADIRAAEKVLGSHVPIIGVTAFAVASDRQRCLEAGMDDCMAKPISAEKLRGKLEKWLPRPAAERPA